jgi:hypothetical protein
MEQEMICLHCSKEIVKDMYGAESPDQFAKRYNSGFCRSKCSRLHGPTPSERPRPSLATSTANYARGGGKAVEKVKTPRNKHFLLWLLDRPCELRGGKFGPCMGDMIYHHTSGGGVALKGSDYDAISSCFSHHELFDNATKKGIGIFTEQELKRVIAKNVMEYVEEGHKVKPFKAVLGDSKTSSQAG